jgi:hypothetical protein
MGKTGYRSNDGARTQPAPPARPTANAHCQAPAAHGGAPRPPAGPQPFRPQQPAPPKAPHVKTPVAQARPGGFQPPRAPARPSPQAAQLRRPNADALQRATGANTAAVPRPSPSASSAARTSQARQARACESPSAAHPPTAHAPAAHAAAARAKGAAATKPVPNPPRACVQRIAARVVQAIKLYPNLHPGAVERVEPGSLFRLENLTDQYRLRKAGSHGAYVPNQLYNFVRTATGETLLHNRYRHPSIAEGRQVLYAGEAFFNNGKLEWWSNGSGHYQPDAEDAAQAALPLDYFYSYQQVIKGEHKRRKG